MAVDYGVQQVGDGPRLLLSHYFDVAVDGTSHRPDPGLRRVVRRRLPAVGDRHVVGLLEPFRHPGLEHAVDPVQHRPLGAKVLHEVQGGAAHQALEPDHLGHVGPAEAIDGLLGVSDDEHLTRLGGYILPGSGSRIRRSASAVLRVMLFGDEHGNLGLNGVGVLGLVDQQVGEAAAKMVPDADVVAEQVPGPDQQVVKTGLALALAFLGKAQGELLQRVQDPR